MLPKTLFRYYPANQQALENIKLQCFFFGGVEAFNDPFECQIIAAVTNENPSVIQMMRERYSNLSDIPSQIREKVREMDPVKFTAMIKNSAIEMVAQAKRDFIANRGVICFSERNENLLMWSHYASGGSGVCLEFRTDSEVFQKGVRVSYKPEPPVLDALEVMKTTFSGGDPTWIFVPHAERPGWSCRHPRS